jgi:hypothetical protein
VGTGSSLLARATLTRQNGSAVKGRVVYLQRSSNGTTWRTYAKRVTGTTGKVAYTIRPAKRGTVYWRWNVPGNDYYRPVSGAKFRIVTR